MVNAVVLINVQPEITSKTAEALADMPGVLEVYSVGGTYDLVAVLGVRDNDALAELVTGRIRRIPGITRTETLIAFRSYSRKAVEGTLPMD